MLWKRSRRMPLADRRNVLGAMVGAIAYGGAVRLLDSTDPAGSYVESRGLLPELVRATGPGLVLCGIGASQ
jgi:hypothetical protein